MDESFRFWQFWSSARGCELECKRAMCSEDHVKEKDVQRQKHQGARKERAWNAIAA